jgi:hypothetical protein
MADSDVLISLALQDTWEMNTGLAIIMLPVFYRFDDYIDCDREGGS